MTASADALGRARVALGAVFLLRTTPLLAAFHIPFLADTTPLLAWPDGRAHFVPFIPALPDALLAALCIARTLAALAFMIGVRARVAGLLAGGLGYVTVLQDPARFFTTHHVIFLGTMLLACTDAVSACALRPDTPRNPTSSAWLIRTWVASIYVWAAIAKLRPDWFDGRTLSLLAREGQFRPFVASTLLATDTRRCVIAWSVVATELALAPLLLIPRTRRAGLALAVAFHLGLEWAASPDLFGWAMIALLLAFLDLNPSGSDTHPAGVGGEASMRTLSTIAALLVATVVATSCSSRPARAVDAAGTNDAGKTSDVGPIIIIEAGQARDVGPEVPVDAALVPPDGVLFPEAPEVACSDDAAQCPLPPSACAHPSCDGGSSCEPWAWVIYYDSPTCMNAKCAYVKKYFKCDPSSVCSAGGCRFNSTA